MKAVKRFFDTSKAQSICLSTTNLMIKPCMATQVLIGPVIQMTDTLPLEIHFYYRSY